MRVPNASSTQDAPVSERDGDDNGPSGPKHQRKPGSFHQSGWLAGSSGSGVKFGSGLGCLARWPFGL